MGKGELGMGQKPCGEKDQSQKTKEMLLLKTR